MATKDKNSGVPTALSRERAACPALAVGWKDGEEKDDARSGAILSEAYVTYEQLAQAVSLEVATLRDGTKSAGGESHA